jgi:hypothetical protein
MTHYVMPITIYTRNDKKTVEDRELLHKLTPGASGCASAEVAEGPHENTAEKQRISPYCLCTASDRPVARSNRIVLPVPIVVFANKASHTRGHFQMLRG